ncbi:YraN family protein [Patescibacteria group bacterium]|nr:YraN family protein [Patescibacteria group bacterium]MBU1448442.1 YraN family protein [Patescibacteria group bacterium]MBU2612878.1 YraN family protein [Patescibacteria group bacterium]
MTPKDPRRRFGNRGEDLAAVFFMSKGFRIVARNWSCRAGEIDLICERDGVTRFVEVKTRRTTAYGNPEEAVTPAKLRHLGRAVESYLRAVSASPVRYQIDVLGILTVPGKQPEFHHVENVGT